MIDKKRRLEILNLAIETNNLHIAPAFSCVEIIKVLYEEIMNDNDKFIMSKGHGCLALYNALQHKGFNPELSGHPDIQPNEGIECTTGSLGHGLPIAVGMALAKKTKKENGRIFVLMSDGEYQEGTTWESFLIASHHQLSDLTIIIDRNRLQALDIISKIVSLGDLKKKIESFHVLTMEIDGHNTEDLKNAFEFRNSLVPKVIIANTIKGKGLSFMENNPVWHNKLPKGDLLQLAKSELQ